LSSSALLEPPLMCIATCTGRRRTSGDFVVLGARSLAKRRTSCWAARTWGCNFEGGTGAPPSRLDSGRVKTSCGDPWRVEFKRPPRAPADVHSYMHRSPLYQRRLRRFGSEITGKKTDVVLGSTHAGLQFRRRHGSSSEPPRQRASKDEPWGARL